MDSTHCFSVNRHVDLGNGSVSRKDIPEITFKGIFELWNKQQHQSWASAQASWWVGGGLQKTWPNKNCISPKEILPTWIAISKAGAAGAAAASAACSTSLDSALTTLTLGTEVTRDEWDDATENATRPLGVNPATALMDASSNARALSRFMVLFVGFPRQNKTMKEAKIIIGWFGGDEGGRSDWPKKNRPLFDAWPIKRFYQRNQNPS
jgi:hypothetical protein